MQLLSISKDKEIGHLFYFCSQIRQRGEFDKVLKPKEIESEELGNIIQNSFKWGQKIRPEELGLIKLTDLDSHRAKCPPTPS